MKKSLTLTIIGLFFMFISTYGQEVDSSNTSIQSEKKYKNYIGISAGFTTGLGVSYRYWPKKSGFQITLLPLYDEDNTYVSFGTTYLREIKQLKTSRLLFYASNHVTNFFSDDHTYADNLGIGVGFDVGNDSFVFNFMIGYAGLDIFDHLKTRPVVDGGFFYRF
jgi:hypothetical protein